MYKLKGFELELDNKYSEMSNKAKMAANKKKLMTALKEYKEKTNNVEQNDGLNDVDEEEPEEM